MKFYLANLINDWIYLKMGAYVRSWWYDDFWWSSEYLLWISRHLFYEEFKWLLINIFTKTTNIIRPLPDTMDTILSPIKRSEKFLHDIMSGLISIIELLILPDFAELWGGHCYVIFIRLKHFKFQIFYYFKSWKSTTCRMWKKAKFVHNTCSFGN